MNKEVNRRLKLLLLLILACMLGFVAYFGVSGCIRINQQNYSYIKSMTQEESITIDNQFDAAMINIEGHAQVVGAGLDASKYAPYQIFDHEFYIAADSDQMASFAELDIIKLGFQGKSGIEVDFDKKLSDEVSVVFYAPVMDSDKVVGVLVGQIFEESMSKILCTDCYNTDARCFLINSNGDIIFSAHGYEEYIGANIFADFYAQAEIISTSLDDLESEYETFENLKNVIYSGGSFGFSCKNNGMEETSYAKSLEHEGFAIVETFPPSVSKTMLYAQLRRTVIAGIALILFLILFIAPLLQRYGRYNRMKLAAAEAQAANAAKSDFFSKMSHDMRTPLNGILGMTDIALRNLDNSERTKDCLEKVKSSGYYLLNLINEVLDLNAMEAGRTEMRETSISLAQLFEESKKMSDNLLAGKDLSISNEYTLLHEQIIADPVLLQKILMNLLSNAVKYTPAGGDIKLSFWQEEPAEVLASENPGACAVSAAKIFGDTEYTWCYLSVRDTGIGMSSEFMEKMFAPYEREEDVRVSKTQGTGLGLPIVKALVDMMHGEILVESEPGKGSKFTVRLPLRLASDESSQPSSLGSKKITLEDLDYKGRRCLLVEDNVLNLEIAEELLSLSRIAVETAEDGQKAVDMFAASPEGYYDIIFMDIQMPVMDGYAATRRIREMACPGAAKERGDAAEIPIIAMTANAYESDIEKALNAGMNAHLAKPVDIYKLAAVLCEYLEVKGK